MKIINRKNLENVNLGNFISGRALHKKRGWIDFADTLTEEDKNQLSRLLGKGIRATNAEKLRLALDYIGGRTYGIFERVQWDAAHGWTYCAGQHYPSEVAYIRKLLIN